MNAVLERLLQARAVALVIPPVRRGGGRTAGAEGIGLARGLSFPRPQPRRPPAEFEWRFKTKKEKGDRDEAEKAGVEQEGLVLLKKYTPKEFYAQSVGVSLSDYVCLYNDPANEFDRHYRFSRSRNIVGEPDMHFANVRIETMKEVGVKSILANEPLWFAVNMGVDQSRQHGLMELGLYDYETLFGIDLQVGKADRTRFHAGASNHAMALMGVDLADGRPRKWLVENSWGEDKGSKGTWTLYDRWFDEHVYTIIAHKRHIPAETLAIFDQDPEALPAWYPGAQGIPGK
ncbi:MAG: C1 family peptidase [Verrucomicrobiales bacterium]